MYMVLVVGFGDKANGQRDNIQENTEDGIDGKTERTDLLWPERQCVLRPE